MCDSVTKSTKDKRLRMATEEKKDVEMKDVEAEEKEKEVDPKQAQLDKDQLTFEGLSQLRHTMVN